MWLLDLVFRFLFSRRCAMRTRMMVVVAAVVTAFVLGRTGTAAAGIYWQFDEP
jgi:hypothetical protein